MKTTFTAVLVLFAALHLSANNLNKTNATTEFGTYEIRQTQAMHHVVENAGGTYAIHYEQLDKPVYVNVVKDRKCTTFLVRAEGIELQYKCEKGRFGIGFMDEKYAQLSREEVSAKIDRSGFLHQKVVTCHKYNEYDQVRLIACFLPEVIR